MKIIKFIEDFKVGGKYRIAPEVWEDKHQANFHRGAEGILTCTGIKSTNLGTLFLENEEGKELVIKYKYLEEV